MMRDHRYQYRRAEGGDTVPCCTAPCFKGTAPTTVSTFINVVNNLDPVQTNRGEPPPPSLARRWVLPQRCLRNRLSVVIHFPVKGRTCGSRTAPKAKPYCAKGSPYCAKGSPYCTKGEVRLWCIRPTAPRAFAQVFDDRVRAHSLSRLSLKLRALARLMVLLRSSLSSARSKSAIFSRWGCLDT